MGFGIIVNGRLKIITKLSILDIFIFSLFFLEFLFAELEESTLSKTISACNTEKCQLVVPFEGDRAIKSDSQ